MYTLVYFVGTSLERLKKNQCAVFLPRCSNYGSSSSSSAVKLNLVPMMVKELNMFSSALDSCW